MHQIGYGQIKLMAVVIDFHHLLNTLKLQNVSITHPVSLKHFIGRFPPVNDAVLFCHHMHPGTFQHFQKAQLQLFRPHSVHIIKGLLKAVIILIWKTGDEIQMLMDIVTCIHPVNSSGQSIQTHGS